MRFSSINPASGETVWTGDAAAPAAVAAAVAEAREAFREWSDRPLAERKTILHDFARVVEKRKEELAEAISREVGKPTWEALSEVKAMSTKVDFSIEAHARRCTEFTGGPAVTRLKPHGVVAVLGPFNLPGHLPNGHIVPALLAGNTVVYKPSEYTPQVAERIVAAWRAAGLPDGVLRLVQGGRETGAALAEQSGIDGLFFTGSSRAGFALAEKFARTPGRILALEMGGNNPLVVWKARDLRAAALLIVQSAYLTAGQRCTCARRLIVPRGAEGDAILAELISVIHTIRVGTFTERPEPFMGPVISAATAQRLLADQRKLADQGGVLLVESRCLRAGTGLLSPGLIDVTPLARREDEELFGPILQVIRVGDFDDALREANATRFGLAAGLISDDGGLYERFRGEIRAGVINWNQALTGASGAAVFGGIKSSGNHRPSGYFAADYCSYAVASIETPLLKAPHPLPPGIAAPSES